MSATIQVSYWNIRGLGAPLRMMMMYSGTPFKSESYQVTEKAEGGLEFSSWFDKKPALKEKNPLINLPYIIDGDVIVTQSNACLSYLGRKTGMMGDNAGEEAQCEQVANILCDVFQMMMFHDQIRPLLMKSFIKFQQLLCECMDIRNKVVGVAYGGCDDLSAWLAKEPKASLDKLDLWLTGKYGADATSVPFFVGSKACAADFHIWEMCAQLTLMFKMHAGGVDPLTAFPSLSKFHRDFAALPNNEKYLSSKLAKIPMNNLMAKIGSAPDGSKFPMGTGTAIDWADNDGMY